MIWSLPCLRMVAAWRWSDLGDGTTGQGRQALQDDPNGNTSKRYLSKDQREACVRPKRIGLRERRASKRTKANTNRATER